MSEPESLGQFDCMQGNEAKPDQSEQYYIDYGKQYAIEQQLTANTEQQQ